MLDRRECLRQLAAPVLFAGTGAAGGGAAGEEATCPDSAGATSRQHGRMRQGQPNLSTVELDRGDFRDAAARAGVVQKLIDAARTRDLDWVVVPDRLLPYDSSRVRFDPAIHLLREGQREDVYDWVAYGADPSGQRASADGIQAAIDQATEAGGNAAEGPAGTYLIDKSLTFDVERFRISGRGPQTVLKKAPGLKGSILQSLASKRHRVKGSLDDVKITNLQIDGVDRTVDLIRLSRFTRGCAIRDCKLVNGRIGIHITDSWSFAVSNNNLNLFSNDAIRLAPGSVGGPNATLLVGNTCRHADGAGIRVEGASAAVSVEANTAELNGMNLAASGWGMRITGNYFEKPRTAPSVQLGERGRSLNGFVFHGNYVNNGSTGGAAIALKAVHEGQIGPNAIRNAEPAYSFVGEEASAIQDCVFVAGSNAVKKGSGDSESLNDQLPSRNLLLTGEQIVQNVRKGGEPGSVGEWRINLADRARWARVGKLDSGSDEFFFAGSGVAAWRFVQPVKAESELQLPSFDTDARPEPGIPGRVIYNDDEERLNIDTGEVWTVPGV